MTKAVIYARYSAGSRQTQQSIEGQVAVCKKFISKKGWVLGHVYHDDHITGRDAEKREEFQRMIKDGEAGLFDVLVLYSSDRFSRDKYDAAIYKYRLRAAGVEIKYAAENIPDGPEGVLLESLMEGWAQYYSEELSRKVKRGMTESAKKGKAYGSVTPIGYRIGADKSWVLNEEEAAIVRELFAKYLEGYSFAELAEWCRLKGQRTRRGKPMSGGMVKRILANEKYTGLYSWGEIRLPGAIPEIIDRGTWDAVQVKLKQIKKPRSSVHGFALTGKMFCGICGAKFTGTSGTSKAGVRHYYYVCKCGHQKSLPKAKTEKLVAEAAQEVLRSPMELDKLVNKINTLRGEEDPLRARVELLREAWARADGEAARRLQILFTRPDDPRVNEEYDKANEEALRLKTELDQLEALAPEVSLEDIRQGLLAFLRSQKDVLRVLVNKVTVTPEDVVLWFNLIEDDEVKVFDQIEFDRSSNWYTIGNGIRIGASPWGLFATVATVFR